MSNPIPLQMKVNHTVHDGSVTIHYTLANGSNTDAFVFNQLWELNSESQYVKDSQACYRLAQSDNLTAIVGMCPMPRAFTPFLKNVPHVSKLGPGMTQAWELSIPDLATEHHAYFPAAADVETDEVSLPSIRLMVEVGFVQGGVTFGESWQGEGVFEVQNVEKLKTHRLAANVPTTIRVKRRKDKIEREL